MKVIITESKLTNILHNFLEMSYDGFDKCWTDWGNYGCDLGECCDPYSIIFVPPGEKSFDNYIFKLADSRNYSEYGDGYPLEWQDEMPGACNEYPDVNDPNFDTIILSEGMYDRLKSFFGETSMLKEPLLNIINKVFGLNATDILSE